MVRDRGEEMTGSREDPHRQARAARELPMLLHSMSVFRELFALVFDCREIGTVVEVGVESGQVSSVYADLGATVYCVEPSPDDTLRAVLDSDPRLNLVEEHSPAALDGLPTADLYVLDGDHNYAVVRAELDWIMKNAPDAVVVLHDVLWPSGRRDFYYQPSTLPPEDVHPNTADGPTVWHDEVTPAGFVGKGAFTAATHAGGERNGVLTAVEDAVAENGGGWRLEIVPAVFGFGVLARDGAPGADRIFASLRPFTSSSLLATMENNRIALYSRVLQLQYEAVSRADDANRLAETIAVQQQKIEQLRAELGRATAGVRSRPSAAERAAKAPGVNDYVTTVAMHRETWGTFIEQDPALVDAEKLHETLGIPILGGHRADLEGFAGHNTVFDRIAARVGAGGLAYEDQGSAKHYFDLFGRAEAHHQELTRLVDVGVFMGGSSVVLAGCVEPMGLELDLVDVNHAYLQFTYERLRRIFPGAMARVRMFHGDLPTYVEKVLLEESPVRAMIHHDGAHAFGQVVKDLSALHFARDRVHSLALKGTHLRGDIVHSNFVDAAAYAVFGADVKYEPLGAEFTPDAPVTNPDQWAGNYFLPGRPEGMYITFGGLDWKYPHRTMTLDAFLPAKADPRD